MPKTKSFASSPDEPAELVEKNSQILIEYSLKNKESKKKKKMVHNFKLGWERND